MKVLSNCTVTKHYTDRLLGVVDLIFNMATFLNDRLSGSQIVRNICFVVVFAAIYTVFEQENYVINSKFPTVCTKLT